MGQNGQAPCSLLVRAGLRPFVEFSTNLLWPRGSAAHNPGGLSFLQWQKIRASYSDCLPAGPVRVGNAPPERGSTWLWQVTRSDTHPATDRALTWTNLIGSSGRVYSNV